MLSTVTERNPFSKNSRLAARRMALRRSSFSLSLLRSEPKASPPVARPDRPPGTHMNDGHLLTDGHSYTSFRPLSRKNMRFLFFPSGPAPRTPPGPGEAAIFPVDFDRIPVLPTLRFSGHS